MKNKKVIILSLVALGCIVLSFLLSWLFLIPTVLIILINQKELFSSKNNKKPKN